MLASLCGGASHAQQLRCVGASASVGQVGISDTRVLSGNRNTEADQRYSGSGGYSGSASFSTIGSGSLTSTASLTPCSLAASQGVSATDASSSGIYNSVTTTVNGGTISGNSAGNCGGEIYNSDILNLYKYLGLDNIAIKKNSAAANGGGIYNNGGTINPDYSNCDFGTGADANTPNDHN